MFSTPLSFTFTPDQTVQLQAIKIPLTSCRSISPSLASITVAPYPSSGNNILLKASANGTANSIDVENTTNGFSYQLRDDATNANVGSAVSSTVNGSTVSLPTGSPGTTTTYYVLATDATRPTNCTSRLQTMVTYTPLPVDLLYFKANFSGPYVRLTWATASEKDNSFFTIERSKDGIIFTEIAQVKANGNSKAIQKYEAIDKESFTGIVYFHLKQTDLNGKFTYSKLVSLENLSAFDFTVSPNPAQHNLIGLVFNTSD